MPREKQLGDISCYISVVPFRMGLFMSRYFLIWSLKILFLQSSVMNGYISEPLIGFYLTSHFIIPSLHWLKGGSEPRLQITSGKVCGTVLSTSDVIM